MDKNNSQLDKIIKDRSNSFLAYIAIEAEEEMLKEFGEGEHDTDITIPKEVEAKIIQSAEEYNKKEKSNKRRRSFLRYTKTAAIVMLIISAVFSTMVISVDAFREHFVSFFFEDKGKYMEVISIENEENTLEINKGIPAEGQGVFYLGYLPEGYKTVQTVVAGAKKIITFQDDALRVLIFSQEPWDNGNLRIDNENIESGELQINGHPAFWTSKYNSVSLLWNGNNLRFMLFGEIELEEMITIAESMFYIK